MGNWTLVKSNQTTLENRKGGHTSEEEATFSFISVAYGGHYNVLLCLTHCPCSSMFYTLGLPHNFERI